MGWGVALDGAPLPFFVSREIVPGDSGELSLTLARQLGGAMDEERVGSDGGTAVRGPGPEKGLDDVCDEMIDIAERALREGLVGVVKNMGVLVTEKEHVPAAKALVDLVERLKAMKRMPREEHVSFAAVLWRESQQLDDEGGGIGKQS